MTDAIARTAGDNTTDDQERKSEQIEYKKFLKVEEYKEIERWCRDAVSSGSGFLFDPMLFHQKLHDASVSFQFPFEVTFLVHGAVKCLCC
jgi:hypothetical protein